MAQNITNTYQIAKDVFDTLGLKEDMLVHIPSESVSIFRKHLSEMIKRKQSSNKYATRLVGSRGNSLKVIRIE